MTCLLPMVAAIMNKNSRIGAIEEEHETLVILDFGSQYTQFIARWARELGVYSVILHCDASFSEIQLHHPLGIILSGSPNSVYEEGAPQVDPAIFERGIPVLGICYGLHLFTRLFGGKVVPSHIREYGRAQLRITSPSRIIGAKFNKSTVWMSHGDHVSVVPPGFRIVAKSGDLVAAIEHADKPIFGLQFHLEVVQTDYGGEIFEKFLELCGFARDWRPASVVDTQVAAIREQVGNQAVICALSGGVDSSVAATLVDRAIGTQQTCIFVDNGLLRKNEYKEVLDMYDGLGLNIKPIRAAEQFYKKLAGITDPEQKRKIIGGEFITIFEKEARKIKNTKFLVQGTLYPDIITSRSVKGPSATIKSHHNVGGLPAKMKLQLIEPLKESLKMKFEFSVLH